MLLKDKVIIITGSTRGIGEAIARRCLQAGAKIMIHGRDEARAKKLIDEFKDNAAYIIADLADVKNCEEIVTTTIAKFGTVNGLVNNAALTTRGDIDTTTPELFNNLLAVNLRAPLFLTQAFVRRVRRQKTGGTILNIGSLNAYCGESVLLVYAITKGGLMTMTRNLADALGREKIRINQINVGWTTSEHEISLKIDEGLAKDWYRHVSPELAPSGQLLTPENIAEHALFWLSDLSAPVNGTVCDVEQYPLIGRNHITSGENVDSSSLKGEDK